MKIGSQIRLTSLVLVLGTAILIGVAVYWGFHTLVKSQQREGLEKVVELEEKRLKTAFSEIQHDIRVLANIPHIEKMIQAHQTGRASVTKKEKANLAIIFKEILKSKPHYDQIRLIGVTNQGREIVRVEKKSGEVLIVKESDLQQKNTRTYFIESLQSPPGTVYFSKIELNREHGTIQKPYKPTLRVALPIYESKNGIFGIIIINMNFKTFIDELFPTQTGRYTYFLTNPDGDFLLHPESSHTFGFEFGKPKLAEEEIPDLRPLYAATDQEFVTHWKDHSFFDPILIHFRKIRIFPDDSQRFLVFGVSASFRDAQIGTNDILLKILAITLLLKLIGLILIFFLTTRLTKPLEWLTDSTNRFAKGLAIPSRPTDEKNEIGILSLAFDHMVASINQKENQVASMNRRLLESNANLAHFVHMASHDLREPARRMIMLGDLIYHEGKEGGSSPDYQDLLIQIQATSVNLLDQITDFRVFANLSQGNILRTNVNMEDLIRSVTEEYAYAFQAKDAALNIAPLPSLHVFENLVKAFYKNLLDYTLKHIRSSDMRLSFTEEGSTDGWILGMMVTSPSLSQENIANVFAPLNQTTSSYSDSELDIAICKRIIERHSGTLWTEMKEKAVHIRFTFGKEAYPDEHHDNDK